MTLLQAYEKALLMLAAGAHIESITCTRDGLAEYRVTASYGPPRLAAQRSTYQHTASPFQDSAHAPLTLEAAYRLAVQMAGRGWYVESITDESAETSAQYTITARYGKRGWWIASEIDSERITALEAVSPR
jgi:hypothetical protein